MFGQRVVGGFPAVEFDGAGEALHVVCAVQGGAVVEAGAGELGNTKQELVSWGVGWDSGVWGLTSSPFGLLCGHETTFVVAPPFFLACWDEARRLLRWCGVWKVARRAA